MSNLFTDLANPTPTDTPFADVPLPENQPNASSLPDKVIDKTARLAAIGDIDTFAPRNSNIMEQLDEATKVTRDTIKNLGDDQIRMDAAFKQRTQGVEGLINLQRSEEAQQDPTIGAGIPGAIRAQMQEDMTSKARVALEQNAVDKITAVAAAGDTVQARVLMDNLLKGDADQRLRSYNTKQLILQREVEKLHLADEQAGWFSHAAHFVVGLVDPIYNQAREIGNVDIDKGAKHWWDVVVHGGRVRAESSGLWSMSDHDFEKAVREQVMPNLTKHATTFGWFDSSEALNTLTNLQNAPNATAMSALDAVNVAGFIPFGKVSKLATIPSMLVRMGERKGAAEMLARTAAEFTDNGAAIASERTGITEQDLLDNLVPSSHSINAPVTDVSLANDVNGMIERNALLQEKIPETLASSRFMNDEELKTAIDKTTAQVVEQTGRELKDVNVTTSETKLAGNSSVTQLELTMGRKSGGGYASQKSAKQAANTLGYDGAETIQDQSGQWFFKFKKDLPESGFYTNLDNAPKEGLIARFLSGARNLQTPFLADLAQQSGNARNAVLKAVTHDYHEAMKPLAANQRHNLAQVMQIGENTEKWYNREQFDTLYERTWKRQTTEAEWNMYQVHRQTNDVEWAIRNDDMYKQKLIKGFESVKFDNKMVKFDSDGLISRTMDHKPQERVFNAAEGFHYNENKPLTQKELDRLKSRGFVLVSLEKPERLADGTMVKHFVLKPSDASISPLRRVQIGYRQGGHRMYEGKWFARQTVRGVQPDTGERFLQNPNTYTVGMTKGEVQAWADKMEAARLAYQKNASVTDIDAIFEGSPGHPSGDDFIKGMENGLYEKETPFVVNYDRELPSDYNTSNGKLSNLVGDPDENSYTGWMRTNGRMYYSGKGEQLKDWKGALAPTLDPYEAINKSLSNVANISSFSDYKLTAVERWVNTFADHLNLGGEVPKGSSYMTIFNDSSFLKTADQRIRQGGEAQRDIIRRNIGWRSNWDRAVEQKGIDFQSWVVGNSPEGLRHDVGVAAIKWWDNKNPLQAMRGLAFDLKLGLFNPAQIILQASTMLAATTMSHEFGLKGMFTYYPLRAYLSRSGTEAMLSHIAPKFAKGAGMSEEEFKEFLRYSKKSGFFDFGGTHQLINSYGPNAAYGEFGNKVRQFRQAGRFFFNEGEMLNRGVATRIAWGKTRKAFPELKIGSPEFNRRIAGKAEEYSFSMSKESSAAWQHGLASIPTQFWAYNARMLEAMLPQALGGSKAFSASQKVKLAVGQFALYGTAGIPLAPALSGMLKTHEGRAPDIDSFLGLADRGFIDEMVYQTSGLDVAVGSRLGTGGWISDTIRDIMGQSPYGEKNVGDILGGATGSIALQVLTPAIKWMAAESGDTTQPVSGQFVRSLFANISTVNYALKANLLAQYGILVSSKGTVIMDEVPNANAFAQAIGFGPGKQDDLTAMSSHGKNRKKSIEEAATIIRNLRMQAANEPDRFDELTGQVNVFVRLLPPDLRDDVLRKAHTTSDKSLYSAMAHHAEKERLQQRMIREQELAQ